MSFYRTLLDLSKMFCNFAVSKRSIIIKTQEFNTALYQLVGEKIRKQRELQQITQENIANTAGILRTTLSNIENGRQQPAIHILFSIATALKTDVFSLIPRIDEIDKQLNLSNSNFQDILEKHSLSPKVHSEILEYISHKIK